MMTSVTRLYFTTQHKTSKTKTDYFWSQTGLVLRPTVSHHITGLGPIGGAMWAPQLGSGRSPSWLPKDFSLFSALRMASPGTIILYYCGSKNEKFLTHSILSQLLCILVMLFDVFLVGLYETTFTVGKWQVMVFTAGKRRGRWGDRHLGEGNPPQAVPD